MKDYFVAWLKRLCYIFTAITIVGIVNKAIQGEETVIVPSGQTAVMVPDGWSAFLFQDEDLQDCEELFRDGCSVMLQPNMTDNY